jgi:hypothetical protein
VRSLPYHTPFPPTIHPCSAPTALLWSAAPALEARIADAAAGWVTVPGLELTLALPVAPNGTSSALELAAAAAATDASPRFLASYVITVEADRPGLPGGSFLNDFSGEGGAGARDFVGARLVLDGVP